MSKLKIGLVVIVVAALLALKVLYKPKAVVVEAAKPALTVSTVTPKLQQWTGSLSANGAVLPWQEAIIGAELNGVRLVEVHAEVGDHVKKGDLLARLADETLQNDLNQQLAAFDEAVARFQEAGANATRAESLRDTAALSAQELQQYTSAASIARAQMEAAKARVSTARLKLSYTRITAPDDGLISARNATLGSVSQAGAELFRLIRQGRLEWRAELSESQLQEVRVGQKALVQADESVAGTITRIAPMIDNNTRNGYVYVSLKAPRSLRAGMFVSGEFESGSARALTLPQTALVLRDGYSYVYLLGAAGRVNQVKVTTGRRQEGLVEVRQGLAADAVVVGSGAGFLNDGDLVRVENAIAIEHKD